MITKSYLESSSVPSLLSSPDPLYNQPSNHTPNVQLPNRAVSTQASPVHRRNRASSINPSSLLQIAPATPAEKSARASQRICASRSIGGGLVK